MTMLARLLAATLLTVSAAALASPGHGDSEGFASGQPGEPGTVDRTVVIEAQDLEYSRESIEVSAGETIRFVVHNTGEVMHDFTIGTPSVQRAHQKEMQRMMANGDMGGHDDVNAIMLEPGESKTLIWEFAEAENVEFACNVPGHYQAGMKGGIRVRHGET